tara:strand:- start:2095 stop:2700 length:606 start_codon:yes stop_codon:yes gene_type:complete
MSRTIYQIAPIDSGQQQGVGILLPMNKAAHANSPNLNTIQGQSSNVGSTYSATNGGSSVFAQSYSTEDQAISNLKNLLATSRGERFMQPLFGTKIRESVFEQNTAALENFIRETITESIELWLPYITLGDIDINRDVDQYSFAIRVNFSVTEQGANQVIIIYATEDTIEVVSETEETPTALTAVGTFGAATVGGLGGGGSY